MLEDLEEFPEEADLTPSDDFRIDVLRARGYREVDDPTRHRSEWITYEKKIDSVLTMQVILHVYHRKFVAVNAIAYIDWYGTDEYDSILLDQLKVHSHNELNAELARLEEGAKSKFGNIDESEELKEFPEEADLTPSKDFRIDVLRVRGYHEATDPARHRSEWRTYEKKIDKRLIMQVCVHVYHRAYVVVNAVVNYFFTANKNIISQDTVLLNTLFPKTHNELNAELANLEEGAKAKFGDRNDLEDLDDFNEDELEESAKAASADLPDFPDDSDLELSPENVDAEKAVKRVMDGGADLSDYEKIVVMRNPWQAYLYADQELKRRWHEAEPYIMRDPFSALWYAIEVIGGRWIEAEPYILESPTEAGAYAGNIIKAPWPEAEARCAADPNYEAAYREYAQPYDPGQEEPEDDGVAENLLPIVSSVASSVASLREGLIVPILVSESGIVIGKACAKLPLESIGCITASAITAELHEDCARQVEVVQHSVVLYTVDKDGSIVETYFNPAPRVFADTPHERAHEALQAEICGS